MERREVGECMKVLFLPEYKGNPYQRVLADALLKEDVAVDFGTISFLFSTLKSWRKYGKPNIVHFHWLDSLLLANNRWKTILRSSSFIFELLISKLMGIKIVWTVHNLVSHEGDFRSLESFFTKLTARLCDQIIVHSPVAKNEVIKIYGIKNSLVEIIPHGNYIGYYPNKTNKKLAKKQLELTEKDFVFLFFGQIRSYKGVPELIDAFKKLNIPHTTLLIVGKPFNKEIADDILERQGNKNIKTTFKYIPDDEIQIYMNAADVVVLCYKEVLTSGAIILAMSFAKPVIAPAMGCIPDVIDKYGGWLYEPADEKGLLKAMRQALKDNLLKRGRHNFELVQRLQWETIAKRTKDMYWNLLN